ncbi:hypothetical protein ACFQU2_30405 [Siccirubricoccus deserti]
MAESLGEGEWRYAPVPGWGTLPEGWSLKETAAVAVDRQDRVYVFNRGEHPMVIFDREGNPRLLGRGIVHPGAWPASRPG